MIITVVSSALALGFYYFAINFRFFPIVMWGYMIALAVLALTYVIYNRGMSRRGVTEEMLPDEWDYDKKREFIEDGERRLSRSRWMLVPIIAFTVTLMCEAVLLFVTPLFS